MEHQFLLQWFQSHAAYILGLDLGENGYEIWLLDLSSADLAEPDEEVVHGAFAQDRVVSVVGVFLHETTHPLCESESVA